MLLPLDHLGTSQDNGPRLLATVTTPTSYRLKTKLRLHAPSLTTTQEPWPYTPDLLEHPLLRPLPGEELQALSPSRTLYMIISLRGIFLHLGYLPTLPPQTLRPIPKPKPSKLNTKPKLTLNPLDPFSSSSALAFAPHMSRHRLPHLSARYRAGLATPKDFRRYVRFSPFRVLGLGFRVYVYHFEGSHSEESNFCRFILVTFWGV